MLNNQYTDCNITALQWRVPSATVIRCTGDFMAPNTIVVAPIPSLVSSSVGTYWQQPNKPAFNTRAEGLDEISARSTLYREVQPSGGYRGGGNDSDSTIVASDAQQGEPGGVLRIYAQGSISFTSISAGGDGGGPNAVSGGGAGGMVVLVSGTGISGIGPGLLEAIGRGGSVSQDRGLPEGGGGGGGILHLIAPSISGITTDVSGGARGGCSANCLKGLILGFDDFGGAGGGFGGYGGKGRISAGPGSGGTPPEDGGDGYVFQFTGDPLSVLDVDRLILW